MNPDEILFTTPAMEMAGFSLEDLKNLSQRHGGDILRIIASAVDSGLSKAVIVELLEKLGKIVVELLLSSEAAARADVKKALAEGRTSSPLSDLIIEQLISKLAPYFIERIKKLFP